MSRVRSRSGQRDQEIVTYYQGSLLSDHIVSYQTWFEDTTDTNNQPGSVHPFTHVELDSSGRDDLHGLVNHGDYYGSTIDGPYSYSRALTHLATDVMSINDAKIKLVNLSNPSRPTNNPLSLAQDIVSIPAMIRDVGNILAHPRSHIDPQKVGANYLGWEFGWLPLIGDIKRLLNMQMYIHRTMKNIDKLYSGRGLRRRVRLDRGSAEATYHDVFSSFAFGLLQTSGSVQKFTEVELWGTIRWYPTTKPPFDHNTGRYNQEILRIVNGLTVEGIAQGVWDLIPWSWLIDWFANVGEFLGTYSYSIPAKPQDICVMRHSKTTVTYRRDDGNPLVNGGNGVVTYETKERFVGGPTLSASIPSVDGWKLSILGALFAQRFLARII